MLLMLAVSKLTNGANMKEQAIPEVGNLRPGDHMWPNEQFNLAHRAGLNNFNLNCT